LSISVAELSRTSVSARVEEWRFGSLTEQRLAREMESGFSVWNKTIDILKRMMFETRRKKQLNKEERDTPLACSLYSSDDSLI
jgi:hypothetical protein